MKINYFLLGIFTILIAVSCTEHNDDYGLAEPKATSTPYLPLKMDHEWSYDNTTDLQNRKTIDTIETLSITDTTEAAETTGYKFSSDVADESQGLTTRLIAGGQVNEVNGRLIYNGEFNYRVPGLETEIQIPLKNLLLLDQNREAGDTLTRQNDTITRDMQLNGASVPLRVVSTFTTLESEDHETYTTANNDEYGDVVTSTIKINLSASITLNGKRVKILNDQSVVETTNYFAKDIGLVNSKSDIHLEFEEPQESIDLDLNPIKGTSTQTLTDYTLNNEG